MTCSLSNKEKTIKSFSHGPNWVDENNFGICNSGSKRSAGCFNAARHKLGDMLSKMCEELSEREGGRWCRAFVCSTEFQILSLPKKIEDLKFERPFSWVCKESEAMKKQYEPPLI